MTIKRKPESPLKSEPPSKILRTSTPPAQVEAQDDSASHSQSSWIRDRNSLPSSLPPAPLTKANLRRLEEMTNHGSKDSRSNITATSAKSVITNGDAKSRFSTTDADFESRFRANGGLAASQSVHRPPKNEATLQAYLDRSRTSASPTPSEWAEWTQEVDDLCNERDVENLLEGAIFKDINKDPNLKKARYKSKPDKQWVNFPKDVGFNNGLAAPKPDRTEGYMRNVMPPNIQALGGSATLVKNDTPFVALPHFAAEVKDWGKSMKQAELQAGYDGAAMVYSRNEALHHVGQPDPPRHAAVVTAATDGRKWDVYAHYAHENENTKQKEYIQYPMASGDLLKYGDVKRGRKVLRNAQDWGRDQSTEMKNRLQQHYDAHGLGQPQSSIPQTPPSSRAPSSISSAPIASKGGAYKPAAPLAKPTSSRAPSSSSSAAAGSGRRPSGDSSGRKAMLPPQSRSSTTSSHGDDDRRVGSKAQATTRSPPTISVPKEPKAAQATYDGRRPSQSQTSAARDPDPYRSQYRDRSPDHRSDSSIKPLQTRRSNSPQDGHRQPRLQNREQDRGRDVDRRDDRLTQSFASGSSTASTKASVTRVTVEAPTKPSGSSMFQKIHLKRPKPKGQD